MKRRHRIPGTTATPNLLYLLPTIPDDAPERFKNALAVRNAASTSGTCPDCGATGETSGPDAAGFLHLTFRHEPHCAALTDENAAA